MFALITVALSAQIGAPLDRVWRALIDPTERVAWDERVLGEVALSDSVGSSSARSRQAKREKARTARGGGRWAKADPQRERREVIRRTSWRFRLGGVPLVMLDETLEADAHDRLVSRISIGSMHFDQTLTLHREDDETGPRTRLGMKLIARNSIAVIGEVVPRLDVQRIVIEYVDTTLRQVQKHCESGL